MITFAHMVQAVMIETTENECNPNRGIMNSFLSIYCLRVAELGRIVRLQQW